MNDRGENSTSGSSNVMSFLNDSRNKTVNRKALTGLENNFFVLILCFCILLKTVIVSFKLILPSYLI